VYLKFEYLNKDGSIPRKYSCQGENISPPLTWGETPEGTDSLMLLLYDRDVPFPFLHLYTIDHWIVYNIPGNVTELREGLPEGVQVGNGTLQGRNSRGKKGYSGPCPPFGEHTYHFELFALNKRLDIEPDKATRSKLLDMVEGSVIQRTGLKAKYRHQ
jgi:Raf kinase inhibitor-like YbhB/YbcL family protein